MTIIELGGLFEDSKSNKIGFKGSCHDCGHEVTIDIDKDERGQITVVGGAVYFAQVGSTEADKKVFLKCDSCFDKDNVLRNFKPCEVYSRVIGYLRPVKQWNEGKQAEFKLRKTFTGFEKGAAK